MKIKKLLIISLILGLSSSIVFADWIVPVTALPQKSRALDQVPAAVIATAKRTYPQAEIWMVEMEHYNVYEVKMSNFMELYIDINGNLLYQKWDD
ncbi:putative periplasmic protein [Brachyspira sp. CAG:700]|nr:putative periplasmic protein [Brachyspira sp. CAG:700]